MKHILATLTLLLATFASCFSAAAAPSGDDVFAQKLEKFDQRPKKIFAHYMGCFPVGNRSIAPSYQKSKFPNIRHDSAKTEMAFGLLDPRDDTFPVEQARLALEEIRSLRPYWSGDFYPLVETIDLDECPKPAKPVPRIFRENYLKFCYARYCSSIFCPLSGKFLAQIVQDSKRSGTNSQNPKHASIQDYLIAALQENRKNNPTQGASK